MRPTCCLCTSPPRRCWFDPELAQERDRPQFDLGHGGSLLILMFRRTWRAIAFMASVARISVHKGRCRCDPCNERRTASAGRAGGGAAARDLAELCLRAGRLRTSARHPPGPQGSGSRRPARAAPGPHGMTTDVTPCAGASGMGAARRSHERSHSRLMGDQVEVPTGQGPQRNRWTIWTSDVLPDQHFRGGRGGTRVKRDGRRRTLRMGPFLHDAQGVRGSNPLRPTRGSPWSDDQGVHFFPSPSVSL